MISKVITGEQIKLLKKEGVNTYDLKGNNRVIALRLFVFQVLIPMILKVKTSLNIKIVQNGVNTYDLKGKNKETR